MNKAQVKVQGISDDSTMHLIVDDGKKTTSNMSVYPDGLIELSVWNGNRMVGITIENIGNADVSLRINDNVDGELLIENIGGLKMSVEFDGLTIQKTKQ